MPLILCLFCSSVSMISGMKNTTSVGDSSTDGDASTGGETTGEDEERTTRQSQQFYPDGVPRPEPGASESELSEWERSSAQWTAWMSRNSPDDGLEGGESERYSDTVTHTHTFTLH